MHFRVDRFTEELRMLGVDLAGENAVLVEFLWFVAEDQYQFVFDVQASVIVIVVFRRGDTVPGKNDGARQFAAC